jgi:hypothetical protein
MAAAHNKPPIDQTNDEWLEAHSGKSNLIPNQAVEALKPRVTVKSIDSLSDSVSATCINVKTAKSHSKDQFILDLLVDGGDMVKALKFFECQKKTNYTVKANSNFAKLCRLTLGEFPQKHLSKAQFLLSKLKGKRFLIRYEGVKTSKGDYYFKVTHIEPETPAHSDGWAPDGTLINQCEKTAKTVRKKCDSKTLQSLISLG